MPRGKTMPRRATVTQKRTAPRVDGEQVFSDRAARVSDGHRLTNYSRDPTGLSRAAMRRVSDDGSLRSCLSFHDGERSHRRPSARGIVRLN